MECEVCHKLYAEKHHIVFRSQGGLDIPVNYKYLCADHHRGNNSPHRCKATNLLYKQQMQTTLEKILYKDYYTEIELKEILKIKSNQLKKMCKKLPLYNEGYARIDIIRRIMGGKLY